MAKLNEYIIVVILGILTSLLTYFITKHLEKKSKDNLREYKSLPFYLGIVSILFSLIALVGIIISVISLWLNGRLLKNGKTYAFKISFFLSIIGLSISSINGGIAGFYYGYLPSRDSKITFNDMPNDKPIIRVYNININSSQLPATTPVYWSSWTNANLNDTLSFSIYYHNTSKKVSKDLHLRFHYNVVGNSIICGTALSEEYSNNVYLGYCRINVNDNLIDSDYKLKYVGSSWYPEQKAASVVLPFNQNGEEVMTLQGINIGTIDYGWSYQGNFVFRVIIQRI